MNRLIRGALPAAALLASPALAHVTLERTQAAPGAPYRGVLKVNHGCAGAATTAVKVTLPDKIADVRPMPKAGWQLAVERVGEAAGHGPAPARAITWSGSGLPDDQYDEFTFVGRVAETATPGETLAFPVEQTCGAQVVGWTEVAAPGADPHALKAPAPVVRIVAGPSMAGADVVRAGDLTLTTPWLRATPGGAKVAGGYVRIANGGSVPDRLVSASLPLADHGEVHEMSMDGGVMRMRPVDGGLTIPPGGSVELRPGGYHLMFMGLSGTLKQGETVQGSLTFERAGTVPVTFRVGGFGAQGAPGGAAMPAEHQH